MHLAVFSANRNVAAVVAVGEEEEEEADDGDVDYWGMTVPALRSLLRAKDLPSSGKKKRASPASDRGKRRHRGRAR